MSFFEEVIYIKRSLYRDYHELVLSLADDYEKKLMFYLGQSELVMKHCEIKFKFDLSWKAIAFEENDFAWIKSLSELLESELKEFSIEYVKKMKISFRFKKDSIVEIRIPFINKRQIKERENTLSEIRDLLFKSTPTIDLIRYHSSDLFFEVTKGRMKFNNQDKLSQQNKSKIPIKSLNRDHQYEV